MPDPKNINKLYVGTHTVKSGYEPADYTIGRFHWNPFRPVDCIGGKVYFGTYYECRTDGEVTLQTPYQYRVKRAMGLVL